MNNKLSGVKGCFKYIGGKFNIAPWIIENLPDHKNYVEPFGGMAHVLIQKSPSDFEVYNDINELIVNMFKVLQDEVKLNKIIKYLELSPVSRKYHDDIRHGNYIIPEDDDNLVKCYNLLYLSKTSFSGQLFENKSLPSWSFNRKKVRSTIAIGLNNFPTNLLKVVQRLKQVQYDCLDFKKCIETYDSTETLFYCDPPYYNLEGYYKGNFDKQDHIDLANILNNIVGKAVVSYYEFDGVKQLYPENKWQYLFKTYSKCSSLKTIKNKSLELLLIKK